MFCSLYHINELTHFFNFVHIILRVWQSIKTWTYSLVIAIFLYLASCLVNHDVFVVNSFNRLLQSVCYLAANGLTVSQWWHLEGFLQENNSMLKIMKSKRHILITRYIYYTKIAYTFFFVIQWEPVNPTRFVTW